MKSTWRNALILVVLIFVAYAPTLKLGFLFDDHIVIGRNMEKTWSLGTLYRDFTTNLFNDPAEAPYYRPLLTISDRIDYTLWGDKIWGFRLTNLLFHLGAVFLLMEFLALLGLSPAVCFFSGFVFAIHPLPMDLQLMVTTRGEQMGFFFSLAAMLMFMRPTSARRVALGGIAFVLALLSKESSVILPGLLALVYWYQGKSCGEYKRLIPLAIIAVAYVWWRSALMGPVSNASMALTGKFFFQAFPQVLFYYLMLFLLPLPLHYPYLMPALSPFWVGYLLALTGIISGLVYFRKRTGLFWFLWFFLNLLPKTPTMIEQSSMMNHWAYAALPALIVPVAMSIAERKIGKYVLVVLTILYTVVIHTHARVRGTDELGYKWTLKFEEMPSAQFKLGVLYMRTGRAGEAIPLLEEAYHFDEENVNYGNGLALAYWHTGQTDRGIKLLEVLQKKDPEFPPTINNLKLMRESKPNSLR